MERGSSNGQLLTKAEPNKGAAYDGKIDETVMRGNDIRSPYANEETASLVQRN